MSRPEEADGCRAARRTTLPRRALVRRLFASWGLSRLGGITPMADTLHQRGPCHERHWAMRLAGDHGRRPLRRLTVPPVFLHPEIRQPRAVVPNARHHPWPAAAPPTGRASASWPAAGSSPTSPFFFTTSAPVASRDQDSRRQHRRVTQLPCQRRGDVRAQSRRVAGPARGPSPGKAEGPGSDDPGPSSCCGGRI